MKSLLLVLALAAMILPAAAADAPLTSCRPVQLTGTHGKFDFIKVDAARRRLLACHTGNGTLDVIGLDDSTLIKSIPTGNAQGVAIDEKGGRYFVSCSKPPKLVIIEAAKLEIIGEVPLPGPADLCAYSAGVNQVFVDNDEKPEMWIVDPYLKQIKATVPFPGKGMEDLSLDPGGMFLVQNLKESSQLAYLSADGKILRLWPTMPADKPHGLARVGDTLTFLVAGGDGHLVEIDGLTGKIIASGDIAPKVDEIAYDAGLGRVYSASGTGVISITFVGLNSLSSLGTVPTPPGTHSIAVDPKTHTVWIAYARDTTPYIQAFTAK